MPAIKYGSVNGLIDRSGGPVSDHDGGGSNVSIEGAPQPARPIDATGHLCKRIVNEGFTFVSVNVDRIIEGKPMRFGFPVQYSMRIRRLCLVVGTASE